MEKRRLPKLGKAPPRFFDDVIFPRLGATDDAVIVGPTHGVDFGAVAIGNSILVLSTDPFFIAPSLGWERAAWFALHIVASDVAVSGIAPRFLLVDLNLPPEMDEDTLTIIWDTVHGEAVKLGIAVVSGHTARYAGCNFPMVGGATVIGVGAPEDLIDPRRSSEGDQILITKGPAVEATGLMSVQFPEFIAERLGNEAVARAQNVFFQMSVVDDAAICAGVGGVTAMHDATECGIWGALFEMARASGRGLIVDKSRIVTQEIVLQVCDVFDLDPYCSISEGTLVASVKPEKSGEVLAALASRGIPASIVGELTSAGSEVVVLDEGGRHALVHPEVDPFWGRFEEYLKTQRER
ncbi:MAG: AIR synthase family protein [Candidatus Eisenbacteria bacterium]|nr:AIR synthase family protein [Candidatus Eisenbacteria bacterium]